MDHYIERVVDLLDPSLNRIHNMTVDEARRRVLSGKPGAVREIDGSFALLARDGRTVRMARSLDRPMRYFLAKRAEGPALIVADRIDTIHQQLKAENLHNQFHPSYTRMVPAHYVVEIQLVGCPDPDPTYTRFFTPRRDALPTDLDEIGGRYVGALADEIEKWLRGISASHSPQLLPKGERAGAGSLGLLDGHPPDTAPGYSDTRGALLPFLGVRASQNSESIPRREGRGEGRTLGNEPPIGVAFSGGIDSGSVFLVTYHVMRKLGMNPSRLKAFTLNFGDGPDYQQAREFLDRLGLGLFLESIEADLGSLEVGETIRILEDYKPLDVECASMGLTLCRGIRELYPDWNYLIDGDGGDENLKDYPIEENPELTIRSVVNNLMLYQEGWGVGRIKHSLTYSGGLSRSYARTYAPAMHYGFEGFSPFTRPNVIEVAEGVPFTALTDMSVEKLYALKGEIVSRGVKSVTGLEMPVFPKRRFQHGAVPKERLRQRLPDEETVLRRQFLAIYQ
jgi:asparagine synthase (glutamine-hydrolysing)